MDPVTAHRLNSDAMRVVAPSRDPRSRMAKELGRRVSKGEYKRMTTKYIFLPPPYEKMIVLDPECEKK